MKIIDGKNVIKSDLLALSDKERMLYDNLMYMSGIHKSNDNTIDDTSHKMKHRLQLIEGELEAGNNNDEIRLELHSLLHKMAHIGIITINQAATHYKNIKEMYFN